MQSRTTRSSLRSQPVRTLVCGLASLSGLALLFAASAAQAGEHLDLPVPDSAVGQCPKLLQIKYPWLACKANAWGNTQIATATVPANATWHDERHAWCGIGWHYHAFQCERDHHDGDHHAAHHGGHGGHGARH